MNELDLATPFALVRANWNRYCDQLQNVGYGGCTPDCRVEEECVECGMYDCDCAKQDDGWSRGRHAQRDRSRKHDRRTRVW